MIRSEYNAHAAMRYAAQIEPRLASVRALHAIRTARRARSERLARWACILILSAGPAALFIIATN